MVVWGPGSLTKGRKNTWRMEAVSAGCLGSDGYGCRPVPLIKLPSSGCSCMPVLPRHIAELRSATRWRRGPGWTPHFEPPSGTWGNTSGSLTGWLPAFTDVTLAHHSAPSRASHGATLAGRYDVPGSRLSPFTHSCLPREKGSPAPCHASHFLGNQGRSKP